jgi:hypothetical protein
MSKAENVNLLGKLEENFVVEGEHKELDSVYDLEMASIRLSG